MIADWDDAYANAPHIPGGDGYPARWEAAAAAFRGGHGRTGCARGCAYGAHPRERVDLFLPRGRGRAGLVVFVHGGYWRAFDRGDWSHLAAGPLARGWAVAMPGYVLAPEARIAAITRADRRRRWRRRPRRWPGRCASPGIRPAGIWWRGRSAPTAGCRRRCARGSSGWWRSAGCTTCARCCGSR